MAVTTIDEGFPQVPQIAGDDMIAEPPSAARQCLDEALSSMPPTPTTPPWDSVRWTGWLIASDLIVAELSVIVGLLMLSLVTFTHLNDLSHIGINVTRSILFPLAVVLGMGVSGTYRSSQRIPNESSFTMFKDYLLGISLGGVSTLAAASVFHHAFKVSPITGVQQLSEVLVAFALIPLGRMFIRRFALTKHPARVLIVDSGLRQQRIATHVALQHGFELVGWVVARDPVPDGALGTLEELPWLVEHLRIDRVIVGSTERIGAETLEIYRQILPVANISIVPRSFELISWRSKLTDLSGLPLLEVAPPTMTRWDRVAKRAVDIVVATVAITVTLPIWLIVAIGVKTTS
ncbi:MAG: hypothetical protein WCI12_08915, partial [Actinomycetes bacterium]